MRRPNAAASNRPTSWDSNKRSNRSLGNVERTGSNKVWQSIRVSFFTSHYLSFHSAWFRVKLLVRRKKQSLADRADCCFVARIHKTVNSSSLVVVVVK